MEIVTLKQYEIIGIGENNTIYDIDRCYARSAQQAIEWCKRKNPRLLGGLILKAEKIEKF